LCLEGVPNLSQKPLNKLDQLARYKRDAEHPWTKSYS